MRLVVITTTGRKSFEGVTFVLIDPAMTNTAWINTAKSEKPSRIELNTVVSMFLERCHDKEKTKGD